MRTNEELKMLQALPLEVKILKTQLRIKEWYEMFSGSVYVSRSGGKDSDVLGDIIKKLYPDVPHVFINTGLEHDSVMKHGISVSDETVKPNMRFDDVILKHGYPIISKEVALYIRQMQLPQTEKNKATRNLRINGIRSDGEAVGVGKIPDKYIFLVNAPFKISEKCCDIMKKKPAYAYGKKNSRNPIIGTMADESRNRKRMWINNGCNSFEKKHQSSQPLSFWTEQDILHYIKLNNIEIASAYGDIVYIDEDGMEYDNDTFNLGMKLTTTGENRTGCVFCMFGITHDVERFVRLKEREPKKYDYVMRGGKFDDSGMWIPENGLGYKFIIDWLNENGNLGIKY